MRQQQVVPDRYTPGGHVRFRRATLEAFRARQAERATAGETLTPLRALEELARLAAVAAGTLDEVSREALQIIQRVQPGVDLCFIARHAPTERDPWSVQVVAQEGITADMLEVYRRLRPSHEFATTAVVRSGKLEACADTSTETVRHATALFTRQMNLRSYLILPLHGKERLFGVLALMSRKPHAFSASDMVLLSAVANQVAAALISTDRLAAVRHALLAARDLTTLALEPPDAAPSARPRGAALAGLVEMFQKASAADVVCTLGFEQDVSVNEPRLWELARQACELRSLVPTIWGSGPNLHTGVAMHVLLPEGGHAAVAAAWKGTRESLEIDHTLLAILAGACVLASSRLGTHDEPARPERAHQRDWPD